MDGAIASHRNALTIDPQNAEAHGNLGTALRKMGDVDGAIASYRAALATDPQNAARDLLEDLQRVQGATATQAEVAAGAKTPGDAGQPKQQQSQQSQQQQQPVRCSTQAPPHPHPARALPTFVRYHNTRCHKSVTCVPPHHAVGGHHQVIDTGRGVVKIIVRAVR